MKNLVKKNQLMITALAIMIAIAGYLQFAGTNLDEKYLKEQDGATAEVADTKGVIAENYTAEEIAEIADTDAVLELSDEDILFSEVQEIPSLDEDVDVIVEDYPDVNMENDLLAEATPDEGEIPGEAVFASSGSVTALSDAKLLKEQTRAKNKETLLEIIDSAGLSDQQKQEAVDSMVHMTEIAEKETAAEILLEAKGFSDVVVSINGNAVDVVVNAIELSDAQRAQIEDIVRRKTDIPAENIIISTVVE